MRHSKYSIGKKTIRKKGTINVLCALGSFSMVFHYIAMVACTPAGLIV